MIDYEKICESNETTYILPKWVRYLLGGEDAVFKIRKAIDRGLEPSKGIELLVEFGVPKSVAEKEINSYVSSNKEFRDIAYHLFDTTDMKAKQVAEHIAKKYNVPVESVRKDVDFAEAKYWG